MDGFSCRPSSQVATDDDIEWNSATEADAAIELAAYIISRDQAMPAQPTVELPEGTCWV